MGRDEDGTVSDADFPPGTPLRSAALPYREQEGVLEVLLITRRGRGGWVIPRGKVDRLLGPGESARLHASEKAGVEGEVAAAAFDEYRHGGGHDDPLVQVFLLRVTRELPSWPESDKRERMWVPLRIAAGHVTDPGLARVLSAAAAHFARRPAAGPAAAARVTSYAPATPPPRVVPAAPAARTEASPYAAPRQPARRAATPARLGLLLLATVGVVGLGATALFSWRGRGSP